MDIGFENGDEGFGGCFFKADGEVDAPEGANDFETVFDGVDGAVRAFVEGFDALIGIQRDDKDVAQGFGLFKIGDMTGVDDVEYSVGEDESFAGSGFGEGGQGFLIHWSKS